MVTTLGKSCVGSAPSAHAAEQLGNEREESEESGRSLAQEPYVAYDVEPDLDVAGQVLDGLLVVAADGLGRAEHEGVRVVVREDDTAAAEVRKVRPCPLDKRALRVSRAIAFGIFRRLGLHGFLVLCSHTTPGVPG